MLADFPKPIKVTGILSYEEVPEELVEALARQLAFYEDLKARNELRMLGE